MSNQIVISSGAKVRSLEGVLTGTAGIVNALGINVPSGIPQLDGSGKILVSQLPNSVMEYKGSWNAATNTPTLVNGTGNAGDVYLCEVAGTVNFGAGPITFAVGDQVIYSGTIWQRASGATGTVTSVAVTETGDALTITGSPITTSGTINIGFAGTSGQYINGAGGLTTFPSLTGFVPYTGATANVDLGTFDLTTDIINLNQLKAIGSGGLNIYSNSGTHIALMGGGGGAGTTLYGGLIGTSASFTTSGGSDTFAINHSSGSGIALNITKGGNGEGLYINKTSGSGNAATIIGTLNATTLVKSGGTSSQFLKADGSVDSSTYLTTSAAASTYVTLGTTQTITGDKTFDGNNVYNGVNTYNTHQTRFTAGIAINQTLSGGAVSSHTVIGANVNGLNVNFPAGGYNSLNFASTSVGNTYTFPNATGTIALTSSLTGYVPYTGATASLEMGNGSFGIQAGQFILFNRAGSDTLGSGAYQAFLNSAQDNGIYLQLNSSNNLSFFGRTSGTTSGQLMTFTRSGNLGIGTSSPNVSGQSSNIRLITVQGESGQWGGIEASANTFNNDALVGFYGFTSPLVTGNSAAGMTAYIATFLSGTTGATIGADMRFYTKANAGVISEKMRIYNSGIITAPSQVSFKAYFSGSNPSLAKGSLVTMPYNAREYDNQNNFSTSTYKFTAPVAGKYLFIANVNMYGVDDAAAVRIFLTINSSTNRLLFWRQNMATGNTGDCNFSGSDILSLAAGNTVEVRIITDGSGTFNVSAGLDYNSFSGQLLG
jgi:hypothetical protein